MLNAFLLASSLGSSNAVLHMLAMAKAANVPLTIDDIQEISSRTPFLANLRPSGRYVMEDLHAIGGTPAVLKYLYENGMIHGDCMTVTGKTMAENLAEVEGLPEGQDIIRPLSNPIKPTGHLTILRGNLAPEVKEKMLFILERNSWSSSSFLTNICWQGAVAKITGKEGLEFTGVARVFDEEDQIFEALEQKRIPKGSVVVVRYQGPKGGPGMPEMCKVSRPEVPSFSLSLKHTDFRR